MAERELHKRKLDEVDGVTSSEPSKKQKIDDGAHQLNYLIHDEEILLSEIKKLVEIDTKADPWDKMASILNGESSIVEETGESNNTTRSKVEQIFKLCTDWRANYTSRIENRTSIRVGEMLQLYAKNMLSSAADSQTHLLNFTNPTTKALIKALPRDILTTILSQLITNESISFPFKKFYVTPADQLFANLQKFQLETSEKTFSPNACGTVDKYLFPIQFNGKYCVLPNNDANYNAIDVIGDHFTEEQRMSAIRADQKLSPMDYWKQHAYDIIKGVSQSQLDLNAESMREELYKQVKECTQFKPTVAYSVYKLLKGKRILDFSAGWGDRLIAAMAVEDLEYYLAFDPNTALRSGHLNAVKTLWRNKDNIKEDDFPKEVRVIYEPFEKATIPADLKFDLCFTSPPFFSFEIYSKTEGQSVQSYPQFDQWMKKFLFVALEKAWNALEIDGHLAIHITDAGRNRVVEPMNLYIQYKLPNAKYCGVIGTEGGSNKIFPVWVWRKTNEETDSRDKRDAIDLMKKYYKNLYY